MTWQRETKGPIEVDRKLLVDNGRATMQGYMNGLYDGWYDVRNALTEMTKDIAPTFDVGLNANMSMKPRDNRPIGINITVGNMNVRDDSDIEDIAERLHTLVTRELHGAAA